MALNPLNRQTMEESWSCPVAFNPLNRQTMEESWSCPVAFNPLNRQTMEESWLRTVAFNPLRGLTLSGTKTHVKQRFLPLTPLLMVSDDLWSPVLPA
ncbi:hypothetical protein F7294_23115 [Salmonella enterica]|nr:hypothetical protein [Salmonella enterica]EBG4178116.1 hypothetical protein [Salmonella enterica]ECH0750709.1 hypothetical protein [Salmonella enterica]ECH4794431.1 hypothetical protein [Salmonella enterica]ECH5341096.1 hypothetical protein [Salmonella enterica]